MQLELESVKFSDAPTPQIAVPKSIDNDILLIDKTFGFETAVEEAQRALMAAKVEASSARRGVGLVKLMGRQSGFIAMQVKGGGGDGSGGGGGSICRGCWASSVPLMCGFGFWNFWTH